MIEVLNSSTGRNNRTGIKFEKFILSRSFASGFSLDLMVKDHYGSRVGTGYRNSLYIRFALPGTLGLRSGQPRA